MTEWSDRWGFQSKAPATDTLTHGLRVMPVQEALTHTFIATNNISMTNMLVLDVDDSDSERAIKSLVYDDETLPEPNWLTINEATGHGHVGYWLAEPVTTTALGRVKPMLFAAAVHEGLRQVVPGDPGYTNRITRSPYSHPTLHMREEPYELREIASKISIPRRLPSKATTHGLGRNCTLFNDLRTWAYSAWRNFTLYEEFEFATHAMCHTLGLQFADDPLTTSETNAIARSVARWVWKNFSHEQFSKIQSQRAHKRWENRKDDMKRTEYEEKAAQSRKNVIALYDKKMSYKQIAQTLGLTYNQVRAQIQYARKLGEQDLGKPTVRPRT